MVGNKWKPDTKKLEKFNSLARAYCFNRSKYRPDKEFIELDYNYWLSSKLTLIIYHVYSLRVLCKRDNDVFMLCSGLRYFKNKSITYNNIEPFISYLNEDISSIVFLAYIKALDMFNGRYNISLGKPTTFSIYMTKTIPQRVGYEIYKTIPKDREINGICHMTEHTLYSEPWTMTLTNLSKIINKKYITVKRVLDKRQDVLGIMKYEKYII